MPVLHLLAGPNGSGKSTFVERVLQPVTHLPFINADVIAKEMWPGAESVHAYEASRIAAVQREEMMREGRSFISETVFSHESKFELVEMAFKMGYLVQMHVIMVPVELSVSRVAERVLRGGHEVPEQKIRDRHARLWDIVYRASLVAQRTEFYDNSLASMPFRKVAELSHGSFIGRTSWPEWAPGILKSH